MRNTNFSPKIWFYVFKRSLFYFSYITIIFLLLAWTTQLAKFTNNFLISESVLRSLLYVFLLLIPYTLSIIVPFSLIISVFFSIYSFISDSELVVFYASGLSPRFVTTSFLFLSFFVSCIMYILVFYITPLSLRTLDKETASITHNIISYAGTTSGFVRPLHNVVLYLAKKEGLTLKGVFIFDARSSPATIYMAQRGVLFTHKNNLLFTIYNGNMQINRHGNEKPHIFYFNEYTYGLNNLVPTTKKYLTEEKRLPYELLFPSDNYGKRKRKILFIEFNKHLSNILYIFIFCFIPLFIFLFFPINRSNSMHVHRAVFSAISIFCLACIRFICLYLAIQYSTVYIFPLYLIPLSIILLGFIFL